MHMALFSESVISPLVSDMSRDTKPLVKSEKLLQAVESLSWVYPPTLSFC